MRGSRPRGFTLIEVLVAVAILGILLTTVYGAVSRTIRSKEHAESAARIASVGREAVLRIADEIEASLSPTYVATSVFQGVGGGSGQFLDQVRFAISSRPPFGPIGATRGGRVLITYYLGAQTDAAQTYLLIRSERPLPKPGASDDEEAAAAEQELRTLVVDNVAGLRLRYLDGDTGQWDDNWDSTQPGQFERRLPIAVEVALYLYDDNGTINDYSTIVDLPLAPRPTPTQGHP